MLQLQLSNVRPCDDHLRSSSAEQHVTTRASGAVRGHYHLKIYLADKLAAKGSTVPRRLDEEIATLVDAAAVRLRCCTN